MMRTSAVGALVAAGAVGAALLAGPMASSQADSGLTGTYFNGGFCYQNVVGEPNVYRLNVTEPTYDPAANYADLIFTVQKWDESSNQYQDERLAFTDSVSKMSLGGYYDDANVFCEAVTKDRADQYLGGDVYSYGEWTSKRTVG
jgi:hypothetical protein